MDDELAALLAEADSIFVPSLGGEEAKLDSDRTEAGARTGDLKLPDSDCAGKSGKRGERTCDSSLKPTPIPMDVDSDPGLESSEPEVGGCERFPGSFETVQVNESAPVTESSKNIESSKKSKTALGPLTSYSASDSDLESASLMSSSSGGPPRTRRRSRRPDSKPSQGPGAGAKLSRVDRASDGLRVDVGTARGTGLSIQHPASSMPVNSTALPNLPLPPKPRDSNKLANSPPRRHGNRAVAHSCQYPDCPKWPAYNFPEAAGRRYCSEHKEPGMVNKLYFGGQSVPKKRKGGDDSGSESHSLDDTLDNQPPVRQSSSYCEHPGCDRWPIFGFEETPGRIYCRYHTKPGMVDKTGGAAKREKRKRETQSADKTRRELDRDSNGESEASSSDSESDAVSVIPSPLPSLNASRPAWATCKHPGCSKWPTWNYPEVKGRVYCRGHRKARMVDKTLKSKVEDAKVASDLDSKPADRKFKSSPNRKRKRENPKRPANDFCAHPGCGKYPSFNFPEAKGVRYCGEHAEEGMVNKRRSKAENPSKRAKSGNAAGREDRPSAIPPAVSTAHRQTQSSRELMLPPPDDSCAVLGCEKQGVFGFDDDLTALFCAGHAVMGMSLMGSMD